MAIVFEPRLDDSGLTESKYWNSDNPFAQANYGLPNCTAYAYGRVYEILNEKPTWLSTGNAKEWFPYAQIKTPELCGTVPKLGAVLCTYYEKGGHVAIVEQINDDGSIVVSQSGYSSKKIFLLETLYPGNNYLASWTSNAYVQGFIYLPVEVEDANKKLYFIRWVAA